MPDFPDVLDHLGKTPRELGAVHLYVESVTRSEDGYACAVVWLQAALVPHAPGTIDVLATKARVPPLSDGRVVKGLVPLSIAPGLTEVSFAVACEPAPDAQRVRQAWKLFDTLEIPKESEMKTYNDDDGAGLGGLLLANALTLPMGVAVVPRGFGVSTGGGLAESTRTTVHKARALSAGFVAQVTAGEPPRLAQPEWTEVWRPGQPLPLAAPVAVAAPVRPPPKPPQTGRRVCIKCSFSGKREDFGADRFCPTCGHEWD